MTATGYADKIWITRIEFTISSVTPLSIARGGELIQINGGGFNTQANLAVKIN